MSEALNHQEISNKPSNKSEITPTNITDTKDAVKKSPQELAKGIGDTYELNCGENEQECRDLWVGSVQNVGEQKYGISEMNEVGDVLDNLHKYGGNGKIGELSPKQEKIAKDMITKIAEQNGLTYEQAIMKSSGKSNDTEKDKFNNALKIAIRQMSNDARKF